MIIIDLNCQFGHRFEGWFGALEAFSEQQRKGLVVCPVCGSAAVDRVPSAVHLAKSKVLQAEPVADATIPAVTHSVSEVLAAYRSAVDALLSRSEDVGDRFCEEARRIHREGARLRTIHGRGSDDDLEALQDEGIDVVKLLVFKPGGESH